MKVCLMDVDGMWDPAQQAPYGAEDLRIDLCLERVFAAMADGDATIRSAAERALLSPLKQKDQILYRQQVLSDCLQNGSEVRRLYTLTQEALSSQESPDLRFGAMQTVSGQFARCLSRLTELVKTLRALKSFAQKQEGNFHSAGFHRLFHEILGSLDDNFFGGAEDLLRQLQFRNGMLIGARLSGTGRSIGHSLLYYDPEQGGSLEKAPFREVSGNNRSGISDLLHRRETAMSDSNRILVRAVSSVCAYLRALQRELAFYVGCLNLYRDLTARNIPTCLPKVSQEPNCWSAESLVELNVGLCAEYPAGNSLDVTRGCCVITGADLGGKTTFLRAVGQSQLLLQCGMLTTGKQFCAPVASGIFTHFQREEDRELADGKLCEELTRMSGIVDHIRRGALLLCDESFCSTNEREGSEIAWQITAAMRAKGISVFTVTHLFAFARRLYEQRGGDCTFLCAERLPDGTRTRRILPGAPQRTSFSEDVYREVFG